MGDGAQRSSPTRTSRRHSRVTGRTGQYGGDTDRVALIRVRRGTERAERHFFSGESLVDDAGTTEMREGPMQRLTRKGWPIYAGFIAILIMIRLFAWENEWVRFGGVLLIIGFSLWTLSRRPEGRETRDGPSR